MTTFVEIHAIQNIPPANINRDDTGAPKTATYGGVVRGRVSSQAWKRAMRDYFRMSVDPKDVGTRSKQVVKLLADAVVARSPELEPRADELAVEAFTAAKLKLAKKSKKDEGLPEMGYLMFFSQRQIDSIADLLVEHAHSDDLKGILTGARIKELMDSDHSIDIALFGRMVADAPDLNVDAACQVAHAIGVHEVVPEYDYFTAVDDVVEAAEETGAGMIGTVEFYSSTFYRYAVVNVDQLQLNLGDRSAVRMALEAFIRAFVVSMPTGKQNTFANGTRPSAVMVTVATGQPTSLVGAFEEPIKDSLGYVRPAVGALAVHAGEVFDTWRRPKTILVCGLPSDLGELAELGPSVSFDDLVTAVGAVTSSGDRT